MDKKIEINELVLRQTEESKFSHFGGSFEELVALVAGHLASARPGYREGVFLVSVPPAGFWSGVVELDETTPLKAEFVARRKGEEAYLQVFAVGGTKLVAQEVEVVLYDHATLGSDASTEADWEIVSINARATAGVEPMTPVAMARNFLELAGGTKAEYTAREFAEAIIYWSRRAMRG